VEEAGRAAGEVTPRRRLHARGRLAGGRSHPAAGGARPRRVLGRPL